MSLFDDVSSKAKSAVTSVTNFNTSNAIANVSQAAQGVAQGLAGTAAGRLKSAASEMLPMVGGLLGAKDPVGKAKNILKSKLDAYLPMRGGGAKGIVKGILENTLQQQLSNYINMLTDLSKPDGNVKSPVFAGTTPNKTKEHVLKHIPKWLATKNHYTITVGKFTDGVQPDLNFFANSVEYTLTHAPANPVTIAGGYYDNPSASEQYTITISFLDTPNGFVRKWFIKNGNQNEDGTFKVLEETLFKIAVLHGFVNPGTWNENVNVHEKDKRATREDKDVFSVRLVSLGVSLARGDSGLVELPVTFVTVDNFTNFKILKAATKEFFT